MSGLGRERWQALSPYLEQALELAGDELSTSMEVAESYRMAGRNREAATAFGEAFARLSSLGRANTQKAGTLLNNWGLAVRSSDPLEAERLFRQAIRISSADGSEQGVSPMLLNNLARTLRDLNRLADLDAVKPARSDADDPNRMAVQCQPAFEDIGRAPIFPLPKVVAEHGDGGAAALIVGRGDGSAKKRVYTERTEKVSADPTRACVANLAAPSQIESNGAVGEGSREDILAVTHLLPNGVRKRRAAFGFHDELDELFGMAHRQRL